MTNSPFGSSVGEATVEAVVRAMRSVGQMHGAQIEEVQHMNRAPVSRASSQVQRGDFDPLVSEETFYKVMSPPSDTGRNAIDTNCDGSSP